MPTILPPEEHPSVEHLVTEDDTPVDNIYSEKQQRLLTRPLYSSWRGPGGDDRFVALANVGMFHGIDLPSAVPDVLLSVNVRQPPDLRQKKNRSYFFWVFGKSPEVVIEIVSNKEGDELGAKKKNYAQIGIPVYVVWDPMTILSKTKLHVFGLRLRAYEPISGEKLDSVGLGLRAWNGTFEQVENEWLRWVDMAGKLIPLGEERADREKKRADREKKRADQEKKIAKKEKQRAETAERRAQRLADRLRQLGENPDNGSD
jgi:Uma2 family endonuclease